MTDDKNPARTAFEAYRANYLDASPLDWDDLDGSATRAWDAVADAVRAPLLAEIAQRRSAVDETLASSTIVGDILEKRLDGVPNVDPQYLADEITTALYRKIKGIDR